MLRAAWLVAWREWRDLARDGRLRAAGVTILALLLVTVADAARQSRRELAERMEAAEDARQQWLGQGEKNPHAAAHYGMYVFPPRLPLAVLDRGVADHTGVAVRLEAHRQNESRFRPAEDTHLLRRFGVLTPATVLQVLVPLLLLLMAAPALAGERERGTLPLVLASGVKPEAVVLGKALGVAGPLGLLLVPGAVVAATVVLAAAGPSWGDTVARVCAYAAAHALYYGALLGMALAVSAVARTVRQALAVLLGLWLVQVVLAPRLAVEMARSLHPTPNARQFAAALERDLRGGFDGHDPQQRRASAVLAGLLRRHNVQTPEELPVNYVGVLLDEAEQHADRVYDRHVGRLQETFAAQERVEHAVAGVVPLLALQAVSRALAGTDAVQQRHFAVAAEDYRRTFVRLLNADLARNAQPGDTDYTRGEDLWAMVPAFSYRPPTWRWVLAKQRAGAVVLACWAAGGISLAALIARRWRLA